MRAIDLYAGIGGWSLGLDLAGIEVVRSYEWWQPAIDTHNKNLGREGERVDIRGLDLATLPDNIDFVVGSPPCTQFSYSNRGGNGDIADGLKDMVRFFEIVERLQPKFWVMENVPRVADVLRRGLVDPNHPLHRFASLEPEIHVYDMAQFGAPQARKRCIAGVLPFDLLESYRERLTKRTLGDVIDGVWMDPVVDPVWGVRLARREVTEMEREPRLGAEELRMNRESKLYHPVYNNMSFPDDPKVPSRTVTATCTRVSRESIVIEDSTTPGAFRRLTIRERACLQGFPITYQFFGRSFAEKAKMVGNAIPPCFTYLVANAARGVDPIQLVPPSDAGKALRPLDLRPAITRPDLEGRSYLANRRFRAALPRLRFKSGMRFELANHGEDSESWCIRFFYGPSRDIREIDLDLALFNELKGSDFVQNECVLLRQHCFKVESLLARTSPQDLQAAWTRRGDGSSPFDLCDALGDLAGAVQEMLADASDDAKSAAINYVLEVAAQGEPHDEIVGARKLTTNALAILSGLLVGSWFNTLDWHQADRMAA